MNPLFLPAALFLLVQSPEFFEFKLRGYESVKGVIPSGMHQIQGPNALMTLESSSHSARMTITLGPKIKKVTPKEILDELGSSMVSAWEKGTERKCTLASEEQFEILGNSSKKEPHKIYVRSYSWPIKNDSNFILVAAIEGEKYYYLLSFFYVDQSHKDFGNQILKSLQITPD